jgi:hypothetical protein
MLRFNDFDAFYQRIVLELDTYINDANVENLDGWQAAAQQFQASISATIFKRHIH